MMLEIVENTINSSILGNPELSLPIESTRDHVDKLINLDKRTNKDLLNQVLKTRILNFLSSWSNEEKIEIQIVFFANVCSNIFEESTENWKDNLSCKYIINRYKPGKYDSLMQLYLRNKPIGEDVLSFFIDDFLMDLDILKWTIDLECKQISQRELFESQISRLSWNEQMMFLETLFINLQNIDGVEVWLMESIVKLVWWWENQDRKIRKKWYKKFLMYEWEWKKKYIKLHPHIIIKLVESLVERPELQKGIFNKQTSEINNKIRTSNKKEKFVISDSQKYETRKNILIRDLLDWDRETIIKKQNVFFEKVCSNIPNKRKDSFTTISKFLWEKEDKSSFSLRRLIKWTHPINENNLYSIIERLFSVDPKFEELFNLEKIKVSKNELLFYWVSRKSTEEQRRFLKFIYEEICESEEYKNITNKWWGGIAATLKNFINPLKYKLSEKYLRQKIKDVLYTDQKKIPKDILDLLIIRLLEECNLLSFNKLVSLSFTLDEEETKKRRLDIFKQLHKKKRYTEGIWLEIERYMTFSDESIAKEVDSIRNRIWSRF